MSFNQAYVKSFVDSVFQLKQNFENMLYQAYKMYNVLPVTRIEHLECLTNTSMLEKMALN